MYSPHYAFQKSFNFTVSHLYTFVAQLRQLLRDNRIVFDFSQHKNTLFYIILMTTCFGHLTVIRLSLQNFEYVYMQFK